MPSTPLYRWVPVRRVVMTVVPRLRSRTAVLVLLLVGFLGAAVPPTGAGDVSEPAPVPATTIERVVASVGMVRSAGVFGSGWIAAPDTVVTNLHVARAGSGDVYFDFSDGERVECYSAVADRDMDLAILRCPTGDRRPLRLDTTLPPAGTAVAVTGYPEGVGPTTTTGLIRADRPVARGITTLGFTAVIKPGSSGSPVFDRAGRVRAVATFSGGLGVPIGELLPLLARARSYPATKAAAEWRIRIIRSLLVAPPTLLIAWFFARRYGRNNPWRVALLWMVLLILVTLAITQIVFAAHGPASFI